MTTGRPWTRVLFSSFLFASCGAVSARGELPPLIPRKLLFDNPSRVDPKISPDGTRLSYLAPSEENVMNIWVEPLGGGRAEMTTNDTRRGIYNYGWAHDGLHLLYIQDRDGDENWHVYAVNLATKEVRDLTPYEGTAAQNMITDRNHPDELLVGLNRRDPRSFDMYRIRISSGEATLEVENPGDVTDWATDADFRIRGATALDAETSDTILRVREGDTWRDLVRWPFLETGSVLYQKILGFTADGTGLYVQSPMGSDMTRLVILDTVTGREVRELAADLRSDMWNIWWNPVILKNPRTHRMEAVGFNYLKPEWRVLDPALEEDFERLRTGQDGDFLIVDRDHADRRWIVEYFSDVRPSTYYLYYRDTGDLELLFEALPALNDYTLAPMNPIVITARDGMKIPCYLTLPVGVEPSGLPLVINPHGGPWAEDYWQFEPWVQLLANRGYAVLQPNFRGSTGYGKTHLNAGNLGWGVGSMQHDLTDAVRWAVEEGIADPRRVAIFGGSYGGYAALSGVTFTPELYACAVAMVGPSNVRTLFESFPPYWSVRKKRWTLRVGPVETDDEFNRRISPLFHADRIRAPLLIAHGTNDVRVKQSESEAIVEAARKNGVEVTFIVYPDEGHGWSRPENNRDYMGRVEEFLARYLGGQKEPWAEIPGSSAEVR